MKTNEPRLIDSGPAFQRSGLIHRVLQVDRGSPAPVMVMLHGRSGSEDAMWIFSRVLPDGWIIVAPRGIKPDPGGGFAWHPRQRDEWPSLSMFDDAVASISSFISSLPDLYGADLNRLYLMGFSQGAAAAFAWAMSHPGQASGIVGLVGFVPVNSDSAIETLALKDLPIFMAVGLEDPYIPLARTQGCAKTLRRAGALLEYRQYQTGHKLNSRGIQDVKQWLAAQAQPPG